MSGSVNKWLGIGNLGADPELKYTANNQAVCNLSLACNEQWKDKAGTKQERTEWIRVTVWGQSAENCGKYLTKGQQVYVEGRLQTRSYDDKEGIKRYATEVVSERVVFLGKPNGKDRDTGSQVPKSDFDTGSQVPPPAADDDVPF
jgi:single-strand DNA-binding protein